MLVINQALFARRVMIPVTGSDPTNQQIATLELYVANWYIMTFIFFRTRDRRAMAVQCTFAGKILPTLPFYFNPLAATREYHVSPDSRRLLDHSGSGKVQPSPLPSEPFGVSARGLSQPKFGQQNEDGASMASHMPDVIMTLVSYFCGLPGLKHYKDMARVPYQSHNLPKQCDATFC